MPEVDKKKRGIFLNIMILTLVLGDIQIPYYLWINPDALNELYSNLPSWYPLYAVFGLILSIAIIIGVWRMKRWAVKNKVELCFTPTYASWANPIEAHFGPLRQFTLANSQICPAPGGQPDYCGPVTYKPEFHRLLRNRALCNLG